MDTSPQPLTLRCYTCGAQVSVHGLSDGKETACLTCGELWIVYFDFFGQIFLKTPADYQWQQQRR